MGAIKLNLNWNLQLIKVVILVALTFLIRAIWGIDFRLVMILFVPIIFFDAILILINRRFVHCYKAGVYYSRGLGRKYINADEIKELSFKKIAFINILSLRLNNDKKLSFLNWRINDSTQKAITKLYD